ncbi:unnamed protein product [Eruca vesicaria subsp. sativa]|uniref:Kri1-like C-terminal domain-containing protein n=1 Tax=Eruca vesicaria subsp. sativa TaxID=29727 RepID=A0ABC8K337_ERUVS|nr:unnamed protein product [Eruca vesicaria subsp. sativa]
MNEGPVELEVDNEYRLKLERKREAEDLKRFSKAVAEGRIVEDGEEDESESDEASDPEEEIGVDEVAKWMSSLTKLKEHDPEFLARGESDDDDDVVEKKDRKKKKKKVYLKDVQARQLLKEGPDAGEEDEGRSSKSVRTYGEQQEELRRAVSDALEADESDDDDEDLLKVKEGDDDSEEDEELKEMADEYFGKESELGEGDRFLRDYMLKQMWKDKDGNSKTQVIDEEEIQQVSDDERMVILQEEFETKYRHEEKDVGGIVMSQSRFVEDSVRKKDNPRKKQRQNREDRQKIAEIERQEELKRLKNVKKKEIKDKMKKILSIAGFKDGEEFPLESRNLDDEFDPDEYDKMMKAAFDDNYYAAEDSELHSDDDDDEKPDFDKEDELLGLPKNWDVIQSGDGFTATREKVLKQKEDGISDDDKQEEEDEEGEEVEEEEEREGKRKRKRKASLVKRANEALMEEYYKLDYEDIIGDLKTRFKFAKVQPNSYGLEKEEILFLDDTELNQYVPLKKMAPYMEKDWEVNKYKLKEQKHKFSELLERIDNPDEKRSKKKSKKRDAEEKKDVVKEKKPAAPIADEEGEAETSKLSRKAKRRRREAEKKLPPNRMVAYGKTN